MGNWHAEDIDNHKLNVSFISAVARSKKTDSHWDQIQKGIK